MWWQDLQPSVYLSVILVGLIIVLVIEAMRHRAALKKIPIRVHVNGTRGKSSVTRLIAAGLRAGGLRTSAKTTGTLARFIYPDGKEEDIYRIGHTNIAEQIKIVRKAAQLQSQALIIECMSLQPLLQSICELKLVRSTHGVLTNARPDHLDVMGPGEEDVALALAGTVPVKGKYFMSEIKHAKIFRNAVADRDSEMAYIRQIDVHAVSDAEIAEFSYHEYKENVAQALAVCTSLGVDRAIALQGMWSATPDPGAMSTREIEYQGHQILFANGFAANDPVSSETLWRGLLEKYPNYDTTTMLINCRFDRQERSAQLGRAIADWQQPNSLLLIGSGTKTFVHALAQTEKANTVLPYLRIGEGWDVDTILQSIVSDTDSQRHLVVGIGNIAGIGLQLVDFFFQHSEGNNTC